MHQQSVKHSVQAIPVKLNGESGTVVVDPVSVITNSLEEIAGARAGDRSLLSLKPRLSPGVNSTNIMLATQYLNGEACADMVEGGTVDSFLQKLVKVIRENKKENEVDNVLDEIFEDAGADAPHDRFAILVELKRRNESAAEPSESTRRLLSARIASLSENEGAAIRAGFNIDSKARKAHSLGNTAELTSIYVDVVKSGGLGSIYRSIVDNCGRDSYDEVLGFLQNAAADDLASLAASVSKTALTSAINCLRVLQTFCSVERFSSEATRYLGDFLIPNVNHFSFFEVVLDLYESPWPLASSIHEKCLNVVKDEPQAKVGFHNQFYRVIHEIPRSSFADDSVRDNLFEAVRIARDEAVAIEEKEILIN